MSDDTYEEALERDARDLVSAARASELSQVYYRDAEVEAVLEQLERDRSVLLVGHAAGGTPSVLQGVAKEMAGRDLGDLYEISSALLFSGTSYIG